MEPHYRSSEATLGSVPEFLDKSVLIQRPLDDPSLNPPAAAMYEPNQSEAGRVSGVEVTSDDVGDVGRGERMEIEGVLDRDPNPFDRLRAGRFVVHTGLPYALSSLD